MNGRRSCTLLSNARPTQRSGREASARRRHTVEWRTPPARQSGRSHQTSDHLLPCSCGGLVLGQVEALPLGVFAGSFLGAGLFVAAFRTWCYGQVEFVTAAMLSRNVPKKPVKVVQLGGGTRELFYYPRETIQVTAIGEDLNTSLMGQAGVQAAVPVVCRSEPVASVTQLAGSSADVIVSLSSLHTVGDLRTFFSAVNRVLSPGGRFIFVQPVSSGGASPLQSIAGSAARVMPYAAFEPLKQLPGFSMMEWDVANESVDPHIVGLAVKQEQQAPKQRELKGKGRRS